jgi:hypothetical protein
LTDEAYIELRKKEDNEKVAAETLTQQHREWRKKETDDRKAYNETLEVNWAEYRRPFAQAKKRPPTKKPTPKKREETPERFWPIRTKRQTAEQAPAGADPTSDDSEEEV